MQNTLYQRKFEAVAIYIFLKVLSTAPQVK